MVRNITRKRVDNELKNILTKINVFNNILICTTKYWKTKTNNIHTQCPFSKTKSC